jgi:hypothetical protein
VTAEEVVARGPDLIIGLTVIDIAAECALCRLDISRESIARKLNPVRQPLLQTRDERRCGRQVTLADPIGRNQLRLRIECDEGVLITKPTRIVERRHVTLLLSDVGPNLINLNPAAGKLAICSFISPAHPSPISTNSRQIVSRCVPVIRSVLRIEWRLTKQLMIWTRRLSGTRFMGLPLSACMQYD